MTAASEPYIRCEGLVKIYRLAGGIEVVALQGLDLNVQAGELLGIVGASGSGKSTLLNVLGGLDQPSAGSVHVGGQDLLKLSERGLDAYRRTTVGFVWQQSGRNLLPYLTALENVELPMRLLGVRAAARRQRAAELLQALGLGQRMQHLPARLSGGEQQRTAIGVALANQPSLLLADEPTGEVDSATAAEVYAALRRATQTDGMTTIVVSHDARLERHTERVVSIRDGKTSTETTPDATQPGEYEELVVLDRAGRLQLPRQVREALHIGDRVRLEVRDGSVMIHPAGGRTDQPANER
jgi:ABC-type lipoprotein export system ATPase subunit